MWVDRLVGYADLRRWIGSVHLLFLLCASVIVASLLLGGGTRGGFLSDTVLQFIAIPLLLVALWRVLDTPLTTQTRLAVAFCCALAIVPLFQLIPLPPWLWTALPNRAPSAAPFELLGQRKPWMPISVSPQDTWVSALALIAPLGIFLGTVLLSYRERRWLSVVVLAVGTLSVFVGLVQVAQGPNSPLRFFEFTNPTEAVGFFANRNHFAALLYALILFAAAWTVQAALGGSTHRREFHAATLVAIIGGFTLLVVLLAGEAMARSRAGLGLTIVALLGAFALGVSDRRVGRGVTPNKVLFGAVTLAVIFTVQYALYRILERFDADPTQDWRIDFVRGTVAAAKAYMPTGSGLGTFVPVYALFETPADTLANTFANHAHNDVLELWLETGVIGLALMAWFAIWFVYRSVQIWQSVPARAGEIDWSLTRAATIVVALVIAHSFVDYPLRTGAMTAIVAFACALMIEPPLSVEDPVIAPAPVKPRRHHSRRKVATTALTETREPQPSPSIKKWEGNIDWPEEWSKSPGKD
jgi:O-antigen ligase